MDQLQTQNTFELTQEKIDILTKANIIPHDTPPEQVAFFAMKCKEMGLSPFTKQIYLVKLQKSVQVQGNWTKETVYDTFIGIDGFRARAESSGKYAGNDDYIYNDNMTAYQSIKAGLAAPVTALACVYKIVNGQKAPFKATAVDPC